MTLRSLSIEELRELVEVGGGWCGGVEVVVGGSGLVCITIHWQST